MIRHRHKFVRVSKMLTFTFYNIKIIFLWNLYNSYYLGFCNGLYPCDYIIIFSWIRTFRAILKTKELKMYYNNRFNWGSENASNSIFGFLKSILPGYGPKASFSGQTHGIQYNFTFWKGFRVHFCTIKDESIQKNYIKSTNLRLHFHTSRPTWVPISTKNVNFRIVFFLATVCGEKIWKNL